MAQEEGKSVRTIQRSLDAYAKQQEESGKKAGDEILDGPAVIIVDTIFLGRTNGVMIVRDAHKRKTLSRIYVSSEKIATFKNQVNDLKERKLDIKAIVVDGRRGMLTAYPDIPTQMCHFHQVQITVRYLTNNPKTKPSAQLLAIAKQLSNVSKDTFEGILSHWHEKWSEYLSEKTVNPETGKSHFTHQRLRASYRSLKTNLKYLFTYMDYPELNIPNTTNGLDGWFSHLRDSIRIHRGLTWKRKVRVLEKILWD